MSIADRETLITQTKAIMGGSFDKVSDGGYEQSAAQAELELDLTYPVTDTTLSYWIVERLRRHVLYVLMVESAHKFQYKKIHIDNRFKHYIQLIEKMDQDWLDAMDENPDLFGSVYSDFSFYLTPGFVYNKLGEDITYDI